MREAEQEAIVEALKLMGEDFNKGPYGFLTPEERTKLYADLRAISNSRKVRLDACPWRPLGAA